MSSINPLTECSDEFVDESELEEEEFFCPVCRLLTVVGCDCDCIDYDDEELEEKLMEERDREVRYNSTITDVI